jgi:predicted AAA+ superfamily ATPase
MGAAAPEFVYYRAQSGAEVDLVIEEEERILALEIKSSEKIGARDLRRVRDYAAAKQRKPVRPYVIYLGDEYREIEGIRCVPAYALHRAGI